MAQARAFLPDTARRRTEISTRDYKFVSDEPHLGKPGFAVMHEIAEKSPVTWLIKFAFGVRTTFVPTR